MSDKRVNVWVQAFKDRDNLMLQWLDPETGKRKTKSAETADPAKAEKARADLEYELNHGLLEPRYRDPLPADLAALVLALPSLARDGPEVYFVRQLPRGPIKIGWGRNVLKRFSNLQCASPQPLAILGTLPGGRALEEAVHATFAPCRLRGEWFAPSPALLRFIREHTA